MLNKGERSLPRVKDRVFHAKTYLLVVRVVVNVKLLTANE